MRILYNSTNHDVVCTDQDVEYTDHDVVYIFHGDNLEIDEIRTIVLITIVDYGSPDKPGGLSIQLCKSEKKEFYIRYSS